MKRIFWGLMCALLILALPFGAGAVKDDALVLYLSFDEGKGKTVNDQSGKGNDGELLGDVEWMKKGKTKSAVFFNEQAQQGVVAVKASKSLAITESLTMEVCSLRSPTTSVLRGVSAERGRLPQRAWTSQPSYLLSEHPSIQTVGVAWN